MTDLAPWLTPAIVAGVHIWTGALVALGTVVLIHCIRAIAEDWPDTTTPEENAEQMDALRAARRADADLRQHAFRDA